MGAPERSRDLRPTASDWGLVGLLQTPTARMHPAGSLGLTYTRTDPYGRLSVVTQPFDWMEAGFRYVDVSNQLYGPAIAGDQTYKDKSFDMKLRLMQESAWQPQLAVGIRDLAGTGLFAGEYVVASKRTGNFDWSLGLGLGYAGGRGNLRNPLSVLSPKFDQRPGGYSGSGGEFSITQYFRGPTALFGGVQWQSPWEPLVLKAEIDGNAYQREPFSTTLPQRSPLNVGLVYRFGDWGEASLAYERGNTLMAGFTLRSQLNQVSIPKIADPPPVPFQTARPSRPPPTGPSPAARSSAKVAGTWAPSNSGGMTCGWCSTTPRRSTGAIAPTVPCQCCTGTHPPRWIASAWCSRTAGRGFPKPPWTAIPG